MRSIKIRELKRQERERWVGPRKWWWLLRYVPTGGLSKNEYRKALFFFLFLKNKKVMIFFSAELRTEKLFWVMFGFCFCFCF